MTYKEQADAVILEMERADWERIGVVFRYAISAAMKDHDYERVREVVTLAADMNATNPAYRKHLGEK